MKNPFPAAINDAAQKLAMKDECLLCPFCGFGCGGYRSFAGVGQHYCNRCGAAGPIVPIRESHSYMNIVESRAAWNTRTGEKS